MHCVLKKRQIGFDAVSPRQIGLFVNWEDASGQETAWRGDLTLEFNFMCTIIEATEFIRFSL